MTGLTSIELCTNYLGFAPSASVADSAAKELVEMDNLPYVLVSDRWVPTKVCGLCLEKKPVTDYKLRTERRTPRYACRTCENQRREEYRR